MRIGAAGWVVLFGLAGCWGDLDADSFDADEDCDDQNDAVHPRALEIGFDGLDNDCEPDTVDACAVRLPCTAGDCSLQYDFERVRVGGVARYGGELLPESDAPVAELLLRSTDGHRVSVDLFGGSEPWAADLPAGTWSGTLRLADGAVEGGSTCSLPVFDEIVIEEDRSLDLDAEPVEVSGRLTYRGRALPEGASASVTLAGCAPAPVEADGSYRILAPEGTRGLSVRLDGDGLPEGSHALSDLEIEGDTVRDLGLLGVTVSGAVDVDGLPEGALVEVLVGRSLRVPVVDGRYTVETYPGTIELGVRVDERLPDGGRVRSRLTLTTRTLKADAVVDLEVSMHRVDFVGRLIEPRDDVLELRFVGTGGRAEVELAPGQTSAVVLPGRYRILAGPDLSKVALFDGRGVSVDGQTLVRVDAAPVQLSGALRIDGRPFEGDLGALELQLRDRQTSYRWAAPLDAGSDYTAEVTRGLYDIFVDGISADVAVGMPVAARGRLLTGGTAVFDADLRTVEVDVGLSVDGQAVDGEIRLVSIPTTRRLSAPARGGPSAAESVFLPLRQGRADARIFEGGLYLSTIELVEGDVTTELRLEDCLFVGEGPPG